MWRDATGILPLFYGEGTGGGNVYGSDTERPWMTEAAKRGSAAAGNEGINGIGGLEDSASSADEGINVWSDDDMSSDEDNDSEESLFREVRSGSDEN